MPILVKDYTWTQSLKAIHVKIPIEPAYRENVDIFTTDYYIKANFSPFLFEAFLLHDIDSKRSKCIINENLIALDLLKKDENVWECLEKPLSKEEKKVARDQMLQECQEIAKQNAEEKMIKKSQLDRFAVQQAMEIDNRQHELMDSRRNEQRTKAMEELEDWRLATNINKININKIMPAKKCAGVKITELPASEEETEVLERKDQSKTKLIKHKTIRKPVKSEYVEKKKEEDTKRVLPRLREIGLLEITHTPRTFPTPSRESAAGEEEAWLKNITLARRATGFVSEDLRPEEQDPQWCKEKGDEFFRVGNFLGAISAYTHGITLSDKLPSLFANRAATHFALGNFNKCANDCSTALELMIPACESNRKSRAKCIARRGAALVRLGHLNKGIEEMKAAAKLLPEDEKIKQDIFNMERAWEQNPDSD